MQQSIRTAWQKRYQMRVGEGDGENELTSKRVDEKITEEVL